MSPAAPLREIVLDTPYGRLTALRGGTGTPVLALQPGDYRLTYQSRFGREQWLEPATVDVLGELARDGVRKVDVVCPGFAVDCLETLEEIAMQNAEVFRAAGGDALRYIPCLNDAPAHADVLAALANEAMPA